MAPKPFRGNPSPQPGKRKGRAGIRRRALQSLLTRVWGRPYPRAGSLLIATLVGAFTRGA